MTNETMPIRAKPFIHQVEAFDFVCQCFGLKEGQVMQMNISDKSSNSAALLMEMG
jgi:hypothetical protein